MYSTIKKLHRRSNVVLYWYSVNPQDSLLVILQRSYSGVFVGVSRVRAFSFSKTVLPFPDVDSRNRTHSREFQIFPSEFLKNDVRRERLDALVFCFFQSLFLFRNICASYYIIFFLRSYFLNISNLFLTSRVSPFFCSSNSHQSKIIAQLAPRSTNRTLEIPRGGYYQQIAVQFQFGQLSALVLEKLLITIDLHASWCNMAHVLRWRSTSSIGDPVEPIRGWSRVVRLGL